MDAGVRQAKNDLELSSSDYLGLERRRVPLVNHRYPHKAGNLARAIDLSQHALGQWEVHTRVTVLLAMLLIANAPAKIPSACPQAALELVRAKLENPDSAMFKRISPIDRKGGGYCGWVNSKNSKGEYEGYSVFFASSDGKVVILGPGHSKPDLC